MWSCGQLLIGKSNPPQSVEFVNKLDIELFPASKVWLLRWKKEKKLFEKKLMVMKQMQTHKMQRIGFK